MPPRPSQLPLTVTRQGTSPRIKELLQNIQDREVSIQTLGKTGGDTANINYLIRQGLVGKGKAQDGSRILALTGRGRGAL